MSSVTLRNSEGMTWSVNRYDLSYSSPLLCCTAEDSIDVGSFTEDNVNSFLSFVSMMSPSRSEWKERFRLDSLEEKLPLAMPLLNLYGCKGIVQLMKGILRITPSPKAIYSILMYEEEGVDMEWLDEKGMKLLMRHCIWGGRSYTESADPLEEINAKISKLPTRIISSFLVELSEIARTDPYSVCSA